MVPAETGAGPYLNWTQHPNNPMRKAAAVEGRRRESSAAPPCRRELATSAINGDRLWADA